MQTRVRPVIHALWRAVRRDLGTFASFRANNFFLFIALLMDGALSSGVEPASSYPFLLLLAILLLFPLSADPLAKIPPTRLASWPLDARQRAALRAAGLAFNPVLWLAMAILLRTSKAALALIALPVLTHGLARPQWRPLRRIPTLPGRLAQLVRNNLRQMFTVLDTFVAILLALIGHARAAPPGAAPILSMLIALALSTYAQCLFSLDGPAGLVRCRLLPLPGWQIVAAKDAAFLCVLLILTVGLSPAPALTFGLIALAIGRYPSVVSRLPVERWRFTSGRVFFGVLQVTLGAGLGHAETEYGPMVLLAAAIPYGVSLWLGGRYLFHDTVQRQ